MKLIGRTLAILAAALVVVGFCLLVATLAGSSATEVAQVGGHAGGEGMSSGFNLGGIVQILPPLAAVAIVTAIVAPIQRWLLNKRRPGAASRSPKLATPAA